MQKGGGLPKKISWILGKHSSLKDCLNIGTEFPGSGGVTIAGNVPKMSGLCDMV